MRALSVFSLVTLFLVASVNAHAYRLQYKDLPNATRAYQSDYAMKGQIGESGGDATAFESTMKLSWLEKVLSVKPGVATLNLLFKESPMSLTIAGQKTSVTVPGANVTFNRSPLGKVTSLKLEQTGSVSNPGLPGMSSFNPWQFLDQLGMTDQFPEKELNIGDTWTTTDKTEYLPGAILEMKSVNKLVGVKTINGKPYLQIDSDMIMNSPAHQVTIGEGDLAISLMVSTQFTGKATSFFDEQAGQYFSASFTGKALNTLSTPDDAVKMDSTTTLTGSMKLVPVTVATTPVAAQ